MRNKTPRLDHNGSMKRIGPTRRLQPAQKGFTLTELLVGIVILLVGVVAIAQIMPTAIDLDLRNRFDSSALIVSQRAFEQMIRQPLTVKQNGALADYNFTDIDGSACYLGVPPSPAAGAATDPPPSPSATGCPVANGLIDFTVGCSANGYFKTVSVAGENYELRWNVVTMYGNDSGTMRPVQKRITLAARSVARPLPPTSLSVLVGP